MPQRDLSVLMVVGTQMLKVALLTIPAFVFVSMQGSALGLLMFTGRDEPVPPWLGFTGLAVAVAAFVCSLPALALTARSDIQGPPRYLLIGIHSLWFVIGGLSLLAALCMKIVYPLYARWVAH